MSARARTAGFTLIEMLAVMLLVGIVVSAATTFYFQLSRQSNRAAADTRVARRTTAALDRLARELENAVLVVKPDERDPLEHPWLFFAEREGGGEGADRVKFVTRGHRPQAEGAHESDLATVAWALREDGGETSELVRWTSPRLPEGLDRRVPEREEDGAQLVVEDVARFGLRFLTEEGQWKETWDSSTVADSSRLPVAVEIALALEPASDPGAPPGLEPEPLRRQVVLPLRPLDLQSLLAEGDGLPGEEDEEGEEDAAEEDAEDAFDDREPGRGEETALGDDDRRDEDEPCRVTVAQCAAAHPELLQQVGPQFQGLLQGFGGACAADFAGRFPVPPDCL